MTKSAHIKRLKEILGLKETRRYSFTNPVTNAGKVHDWFRYLLQFRPKQSDITNEYIDIPMATLREVSWMSMHMTTYALIECGFLEKTYVDTDKYMRVKISKAGLDFTDNIIRYFHI